MKEEDKLTLKLLRGPFAGIITEDTEDTGDKDMTTFEFQAKFREKTWEFDVHMEVRDYEDFNKVLMSKAIRCASSSAWFKKRISDMEAAVESDIGKEQVFDVTLSS